MFVKNKKAVNSFYDKVGNLWSVERVKIVIWFLNWFTLVTAFLQLEFMFQFSINYFSKFRVPEWRRRILNRKVLSICRFIWKIFSRKAFVYYRETVPVWPQFNWQFLLKMNNLSTYTNNLFLSKIKTSKTSKTIKTLQSQRVNLIITNNYPISRTNNPIDYSLVYQKKI